MNGRLERAPRSHEIVDDLFEAARARQQRQPAPRRRPRLWRDPAVLAGIFTGCAIVFCGLATYRYFNPPSPVTIYLSSDSPIPQVLAGDVWFDPSYRMAVHEDPWLIGHRMYSTRDLMGRKL